MAFFCVLKKFYNRNWSKLHNSYFKKYKKLPVFKKKCIFGSTGVNVMIHQLNILLDEVTLFPHSELQQNF